MALTPQLFSILEREDSNADTRVTWINQHAACLRQVYCNAWLGEGIMYSQIRCWRQPVGKRVVCQLTASLEGTSKQL